MKKTVRTMGIRSLDLERLRDQVGQLFVTLQEAIDAEIPPIPGIWCPPFDLCETATHILIWVELPGVDAATIDIRLTNVQLSIRGEKLRKRRKPIVSHLCSERNYGRFCCTVAIRWPISVRESSAEHNNGILLVRLPKLLDRRGEEFKVPVENKVD